MASPLRSIADLMSQQNSYGNWNVLYKGRVAANTTAATTSSGYESCQKYREILTVPTMTSPITAAYCVYQAAQMQTNAFLKIGAETLLGTITLNGGSGTFVDGSAMPSRKVAGGSSAATAAYEVFAVVTTVLSATTPSLVVTYTNEAGTGSHTATLTIPTNSAVDSAFRITPHLQSGDFGIQDVTAVTCGGTSGVIKIYGILPITSNVGGGGGVSLASQADEIYAVQGGDTIGFYRIGAIAADRMVSQLVFAGES